MINKELAWQYILQNSKKAMLTNMVYQSLVDKKSYCILSVTETAITIKRLSGGDDVPLTKSKVFTTIGKLNTSSTNSFPRASLISPTVAEETAFVLFCPFVTWDATGSYISKKV